MIRRALWPVFLRSSACSGTYRTPVPGVLLCCWARQAHRGAPLPGVLLCSLMHQSLIGAPWVGSYSVVQGVRHLMGQPLYCSTASAGVWGEGGYGDDSTPYTWFSSIALLPWLPGFLPQVFPTAVSSLTSSQSVSAVNSSPRPGITPQSPNSSS